MILMVVVAFAFLIRGGREKFSPWICIIGISIFAVGLKLPVVDTPFDGSILILSCLFVLAGIGLESFFVKEEAPSAENLEVKEDLVKKLDNKQKLETKQVIEKKDAYTEQNHENENKIRSFKEKRRQKLIDYMEHPESLDDKNFIVKLWFEREKKKYESQMAIERVMNTLVSLSEDHIVWTDGVRTKQNMLTPDAKTVNVPQSVPSSQIDEKTKKENDTIILPQNKGNLEDPDLDYDFEVPEDDDYDYD